MKLSQLRAAYEAAEEGSKPEQTLDELIDLVDDLDEFRVMLSDIDSGTESVEVSTENAGAYLSVHPSAVPLVRQAIEQSIACIESELRRHGVEIDEPATQPASSAEAAA